MLSDCDNGKLVRLSRLAQIELSEQDALKNRLFKFARIGGIFRFSLLHESGKLV